MARCEVSASHFLIMDSSDLRALSAAAADWEARSVAVVRRAISSLSSAARRLAAASSS
jgi:hypothetical protein